MSKLCGRKTEERRLVYAGVRSVLSSLELARGCGEWRVGRPGGKLVVSHTPDSRGSLSGAKRDGEPPSTLKGRYSQVNAVSGIKGK